MADRYTNNPLRNAGAFTTHDPTIVQGGATFYQTIPAIEVAILSLTRILIWGKILVATEISTATMSLIKTFLQILSVVESSVIGLARGMFKSLIVSAISSAVMIKCKIWIKTLSAVTGAKIPEMIMTTGGKILKKIKDKIYMEI